MRRTAAEAAETRSDLLDAGLRLFARDGYAQSTLAEIAKTAGVTRGAAYHHFKDKTELYLAVVTEKWAAAVAPVWAPLDEEGPAVERLHEHLVRYFTALERDETLRSLLGVTIYKAGSSPELAPGLDKKRDVMRLWVRQIADVLAEAELRPGMDVELAAYGIVSTMSGVTSMWLGDTTALSPASSASALSGSLGAAVALRVLADTEIPVFAGAIVNGAVRLRSVVELFPGDYPYDAESEKAVNDLDFVTKAKVLANRAPLLVVSGELDHPARAPTRSPWPKRWAPGPTSYRSPPSHTPWPTTPASPPPTPPWPTPWTPP